MIRPRQRQRQTYDEIPAGQQLSRFDGPIRAIGETVLNHKKDIKFHRTAENRVGAQKYANQHNLLLGPDEDINGDGINDVVLYKKDGTPVMINGYTFKDSEMPYRNEFNARNPTKADRVRVGGYSGFMKAFRSDEEALNEFVHALAPGYAKKKKYTQRPPSTYQNITKRIRENLKTGLEMINEQLGNEYNWIITRFPYMKAINTLYVDYIIYQLWNRLGPLKEEIMNESATPNGRYELFKSQLKTKHYKLITEQMLTSEQFRTDFDQFLQAHNIQAFLRDVCQINDATITDLGTDTDLKENIDTKVNIINYIENMGQRLDQVKQANINNIFDH